MNVELLVEYEMAGETKVLGENLPLCKVFLKYRSQYMQL
jgi:hypothetical protein